MASYFEITLTDNHETTITINLRGNYDLHSLLGHILRTTRMPASTITSNRSPSAFRLPFTKSHSAMPIGADPKAWQAPKRPWQSKGEKHKARYGPWYTWDRCETHATTQVSNLDDPLQGHDPWRDKSLPPVADSVSDRDLWANWTPPSPHPECPHVAECGLQPEKVPASNDADQAGVEPLLGRVPFFALPSVGHNLRLPHAQGCRGSGATVPTGMLANFAVGEMDASEEQHHKFEVDDWVIANSGLASIVRFGFDQYEGQTRVLRPDESMDDFRAGRWLPASALSRLTYPAPFTVTRSFLSGNSPPFQLNDGMTGQLRKFDKDGDLVVTIDGHPGRHCVFVPDATNLEFG